LYYPDWFTVKVIIADELGMDLLCQLVPKICDKFGNLVKFVIGGDGPKKIDLEQMRDNYRLHDQIELLGSIPTKDTPSILQRGHIFLNCSLTEAFCMAIVEAASCGLLVVSTNVGGIPEVLPRDLIRLSNANVTDLEYTLCKAIEDVHGGLDTSFFHDTVKNLYCWEDVARRTEAVYKEAMNAPKLPLIEALKRYYGCGEYAGKFACVIVVMNALYRIFLEWFLPKEKLEQPFNTSPKGINLF
jgi:phosphatidylinositol N-acetylglucosaminyltransferase subunit A